MAADRGFEPRLTDSESAVLPVGRIRIKFGGPRGSRTHNLQIKSLLLCQLS